MLLSIESDLQSKKIGYINTGAKYTVLLNQENSHKMNKKLINN